MDDAVELDSLLQLQAKFLTAVAAADFACVQILEQLLKATPPCYDVLGLSISIRYDDNYDIFSYLTCLLFSSNSIPPA